MPISGPASYLPATDDFIAHWLSAGAALGAAGPIVVAGLSGPASVAALTALRDTLATQRAAVESARNNVEANRADINLTRGLRTETEALIYPILKAYRQRVPSEFLPGSAILETLPRLSPLPGHTPPPPAPVLNGTLDPVTDLPVLAWEPSADPAVVSFQLRANAGPDYDEEDDTILGDFPAAGPTRGPAPSASTSPAPPPPSNSSP